MKRYRDFSADYEGHSNIEAGQNMPYCPLPPVNEQDSWIPLISVDEWLQKNMTSLL